MEKGYKSFFKNLQTLSQKKRNTVGNGIKVFSYGNLGNFVHPQSLDKNLWEIQDKNLISKQFKMLCCHCFVCFKLF